MTRAEERGGKMRGPLPFEGGWSARWSSEMACSPPRQPVSEEIKKQARSLARCVVSLYLLSHGCTQLDIKTNSPKQDPSRFSSKSRDFNRLLSSKMRSSMKHCISKWFNPLDNQKPILLIPISFAPPSLLSPNDKRGIKWTRVRHQQVRRGCRCRSRSVGRRCRMTTLAKSPCEVHKTAAAAAARMSPAPSPPPPPVDGCL